MHSLALVHLYVEPTTRPAIPPLHASRLASDVAAGAALAGIIRTPGILAGLNERSQSAYAAPAPKPVESAMGHARPANAVVSNCLRITALSELKEPSRTLEEDY